MSREKPLTVQERLSDMQTLLILKNIRGQHDEDPTVLRALDHAIGIVQKRVDKDVAQAADDPRKQMLRRALQQVEQNDAWIMEVGAERETETIDVTNLGGASAIRAPGRSTLVYTFRIETKGMLEQ